MITNKNIEHDIYDLLKTGDLKEIIRHYKIIKKRFPKNENVLKINQRPFALDSYKKVIDLDLSKFNSPYEILETLVKYSSVSPKQNNHISIEINKDTLDEMNDIKMALDDATFGSYNSVILDIVDNTKSQIDEAVASVNANIDYFNMFHVMSLDIKNNFRSNPLYELSSPGIHEWSNVQELKEYLDERDKEANSRYADKIKDVKFSSEETNRKDNVLNLYKGESSDHMYIRMAPLNENDMTYEEWRDALIERYIKINSPEYYKMLNTTDHEHEEYYKKKLENIINSSELPTYSDIIAYGKIKYDELKKLEEIPDDEQSDVTTAS